MKLAMSRLTSLILGTVYIQVKDNKIVDSGSLKGNRVLYIQVTAMYRSTLQ